jgi:hypothetical protein
MTTETMNIHQALAEQKMVDERIRKEIQSDTKFVSTHSASNDRVDGIKEDEFIKQARAKMDKITAMIARRDAIHRAVQQSNAETKVTIDGKEYSVAEAIWMKQYGTQIHKDLLKKISDQYDSAKYKVATDNVKLEDAADKFVNNIYDSKDTKADPEAVAKIRQDYIDARRTEIVDPVSAIVLMDSIKESIDKFQAEVDTALSTSNAITEITIEY